MSAAALAPLVSVLFAVAAVLALVALVDGALRWLSAFRQLRKRSTDKWH